jgi:glutamate-1-semialdehyde 2,1-aminomutase
MFDRVKLKGLLAEEIKTFALQHPRSKAYYREGRRHLLYGVPMNWMQMWPGGFPIVVSEAKGAQVIDLDGHQYVDLCLGYSAALNGHNPKKIIAAVTRQMQKGSVFTLPSEKANETGSRLEERFGLPVWGFALSATDANRFVLRIARQVTGRKKILVFDGCYHGTVSECFIALENGKAITRPGNMGKGFDTPDTTCVIHFNDLQALEKTLRTEEIACLIMEPAMTNMGIIHPEEGFLEACRKLTRETGTIWVIDEAHTITAGHKGYTGRHDLKPDILVLGKCIGGGFPVGCYGMTHEIAERLYKNSKPEFADTSGIGGTMTGSPLAMAAITATLDYGLTEEAFSKSIALADEFVAGIDRVIKKYKLPLCTNQLGARAEYVFSGTPARNAAENIALADHELYEYFFVASLNRGFILSPYFNIMASFSSAMTMTDIKRHEAVFEDIVMKLLKL